MADTTPCQSVTPIDEANFGSYRKILVLSGPLILSHMGVMIMQVVDGVLLARYGVNDVAAIGPAGMTYWLLCGFCVGLVGYTNTFVAQYVGARRQDRVGAAVWQGIYLAIMAGAVLACASLASQFIFRVAGHDPAIASREATYFRILCYGGVLTTLSAAVSGFFAGRNDNVPLMAAHVAGNVVNAVLGYGLIFGRLGLPEMGIAGAAYATVIGQGVPVAILVVLLMSRRFREEFGTWRDRSVDMRLMWRMCKYGMPNGVRYILEILAWDVFLMLIGRVSSDGLAASSIAFRINGTAFFPVVGLATAVSMLVGQAQGANRPDLVRKVTKRGLILGEMWMVLAVAPMVGAPRLLLSLFFDPANAANDATVQAMAVHILMFVSVYCLADNVNIILMSVLTGAGDTRWMLFASGGVHLVFAAVLVALVWAGAGVYSMWAAATVFICSVVVVWIVRFRSGRWETKRVIEQPPPDVATVEVIATSPL